MRPCLRRRRWARAAIIAICGLLWTAGAWAQEGVPADDDNDPWEVEDNATSALFQAGRRMNHDLSAFISDLFSDRNGGFRAAINGYLRGVLRGRSSMSTAIVRASVTARSSCTANWPSPPTPSVTTVELASSFGCALLMAL